MFPIHFSKFSPRRFLRALYQGQSRRFTWAELRDVFHFANRRLSEEHLTQVAGSLTFTTTLALVPILTIALAIFTAFPLFNTFRTSLEEHFINNLMPEGVANTILDNLNQFASKSASLSAVGGVALILTTGLTMSTIDQVFNRIWRVKTQRPLIQRILVYWALVTLGPLLIGVSISVTSQLTATTNGLVVGWLGKWLYTLVSISLTTMAYTMLYVAIPNQVVDWRDAIWGGLLAAIAFEVAKRIFAAYIVKFPTYTVIYGALAALPIFLLWMYMLWFITLIGAVVVAAIPVIKYERWWHQPTPGGAFVDAMSVLQILYSARHYGTSAAVSASQIRRTTRLGFDELENLLQQMLDVGWVARLRTEIPRRKLRWNRHKDANIDRWALMANPDQLQLAEIYRLFVFSADDLAHDVTPLAKHVEEAIEQGLEQSLASYFGKPLVH